MTNINPQDLVGRYFVSEWGYEQTNVDFYKVVKATAKCVYVTRVKSRRVYDDQHNYIATPTDEFDDVGVRCFGEKEVMRKKLLTCTSYPAFDLPFSLGVLYDGEGACGSSGY